MAKLKKALKAATDGVQQRTRALPKPASVVEIPPEDATPPQHKAKEYVEIEVTGSTGKKYKIAAPKTYMRHVPRTWEWDAVKFHVAEAIADGMPISRIAEDPAYGVNTRLTIYAWLEHPEFREHVDGLISETGYASRRERIAGMSFLTKKLYEKIVDELSTIKLTDKSVGAILSAISTNMKQLAQEKGEFVEQQNVTQQTTLSGAVGVGVVKLEKTLQVASEDERAKLEAEFDSMGDEIIRAITGDK